MIRDRARYEVFPAQAMLVGGHVRVAWSWRQIRRSNTFSHAKLYDTLEDCLTAINLRCRRRASPAVRVVLDPAKSRAQ